MLRELNDDDYEFLAYLLSEMGPMYIAKCYRAFKKYQQNQPKPITEAEIQLCRKLLDNTRIRTK